MRDRRTADAVLWGGGFSRDADPLEQPPQPDGESAAP